MNIFASDIDHTLTCINHTISTDVKLYLQSMQEKGWVIVFLTGRNYMSAKRILKGMNFPFYLGTLNGSEMFSMPEGIPPDSNRIEPPIEERLFTRMIGPNEVRKLDSLFNKESYKSDFLILDTHESDNAYYRLRGWDKELVGHIENLKAVNNHNFVQCEDFSEKEFNRALACKTFGSRFDMLRVIEEIRDRAIEVDVSCTVDVFHPSNFVLLISAYGVNKGSALRRLIELKKLEGKIVAAGDDQNDVSMLRLADLRIAIRPKVEELKDLATVVTDSIIDGLRQLDV